ncbi:PREDICTED: uncharacterized protein LOC106126989 [Papilio xuthus]|uniref:Uncharacterized protein LOC106126989 n=1 Tax=Papilio xuthus TaxID=66420 RepID=A0AAJ6ZW49_PAPXU|nr:PREDICTED: uncharacterized protein LOC106126989 [Papilio xuthus]
MTGPLSVITVASYAFLLHCIPNMSEKRRTIIFSNVEAMCASATAALLLGALAVLPSRGTEADATLTILKETREAGSQPTINQLYQMLYRSPDSHNQTKLLANSNFSNLDIIPTLKPHNQLEYSPPSDKQVKCCFNDSFPSQFTANKHTEGVYEVNITKDHKKFRKRRVLNITRTEEFIGYGYYAEATAVPMINTPPVIERRRKIGEVGSNAPLLNYIFDTYSNTHQHRNEKPGNGNSIYAAAAPEMEALVGSTAHLDCKVDALHDKLVSWVRRKNDEEPMELLTTGTQLYTADKRYSARFIPPDIWRLEVREVRPTDAAHYDCQLSAHPPRTARVTLLVPVVSVRIVDGAGASVTEQVCELGSTVALRCEVRGLRMEGGPSLLWYRREYLLNDDTTRGGISVRTEFGANGANSVLRVARVRADDAGRYSCSVARAPPPAPPPATVMLHVIKGDNVVVNFLLVSETETSVCL